MKKEKYSLPIWAKYLINLSLFVLFLIVVNVMISNKTLSTYNTKVLILVGINIILAQSLNIATGYLGQLPLGHAGFMAVGAYAAGIFLKKVQLPNMLALILALIIAGVLAALVGVIIGIPALRLHGDYLAIITLGFGEIIRVILLNIDQVLGFDFTYGAASLKGIPKLATFTNTFIVLGICCFIIHCYMKSRHGRAILSIRENEIAAESCGIQTTYYKVFGFAMSAFFAGIAGALYACYIGILNPSNFAFMKSIEILVMVVFGGMGSMIGSVVAPTILTILPEVLRSFSQYRMLIYSVVLILMMIFKPSGLFGMYDFSMGRLLDKAINFIKDKKSAKEEK